MELKNIEIQDEILNEPENQDETAEVTPEEQDSESDSESSLSSEAESIFTPPADLPGEKSIWRDHLPLPLCIFTNTESNGCTTLNTDDELLEHALGHLDESLSPVFVLDEADHCDYSVLIPYETAYRSPAREVTLRASRDGLKWIRIPTQTTDHATHEDVKFAKVNTRRYTFITLVYRIGLSRLYKKSIVVHFEKVLHLTKVLGAFRVFRFFFLRKNSFIHRLR